MDGLKGPYLLLLPVKVLGLGWVWGRVLVVEDGLGCFFFQAARRRVVWVWGALERYGCLG